MAEVDRIHHVIQTHVVTPRVSEGGDRRQPKRDERESPQDKLELTLDATDEPEPESEPVDLVEEPYRLDLEV